tara:strand:- start:974 stop:1825 length:852 start_codon:yes stop_codon:yes gene_type:complete
MAVPSSGQLRLRADINQEVNGNDTDNNVSLGTLSNEAGFTDPDNMSEFYGYQACTAPTQLGSQSFSINTSGNLSAQAIMRGNGGCDITECGVYVGTSSSIGSATKYNQHSSWGMHSWRYFNVSGMSANTTYYCWIYAKNDAGETQFSLGSTTSPPPLIPVTGRVETRSGDWSSANYCPNFNFNGGFSPIQWTNSQTTTIIDVYGNNSTSAFQHATNNSTYPGCKNTFGTYQPQGPPLYKYGASLRGTCYDFSQCNSTRYIYIRYYTSNYSDIVVTTSRACPSC